MPASGIYGIKAPDAEAARSQRSRFAKVSPAFTWNDSGDLEMTSDARRVVEAISEGSGRRLEIRPANSVMANEGSPVWGSGGGFVEGGELGKGVGYVDPIDGNTFVVAHEGAHAVSPTALRSFQQERVSEGEWGKVNPLDLPRDGGQRLRYVHETYAKPSLIEEASANGTAEGVLAGLGLPGPDQQDSWGSPLAYPSSFHRRGIGRYAQLEIGPPAPAEVAEWERIGRGSKAAMERTYAEARERGLRWASGRRKGE